MSSQAPGAIQVEKVLDDLIHRLVNGENSADVRAALIEARRLRNVAMRWAAIPPPPDARREMLARVMELIDSVNQTTERSSGERTVDTGRARSLPPDAGKLPSLGSLASKPPPSAPRERSIAPAKVAPDAPPTSARAAPVLVAPEPHPAFSREEPTVDEILEAAHDAEPIPDLGAPRVPTFDIPPAPTFGPPPASTRAAVAPPADASPIDAAPLSPPAARPLTLRPPSAPTEPFERSVSSPPVSARRMPIKAVPSVRGEGLEGLSTTISSSQRKAVREADFSTEAEGRPAESAASASPSVPRLAPSPPSPRKPPPLPKRPPSVAAMPAASAPASSPDAPPTPRAAPAPTTQRPPPPGHDVTTALSNGLVLVRPSAAEWQPHPVWSGTSMKLLYHNPENGGEYTALVRLDSGAVLPQRRHVKSEEMWVVSGGARVGGVEIRAGEYTRAEPGSVHPKIATASGCVFLLKGYDDDEILDSTPPVADLELDDA